MKNNAIASAALALLAGLSPLAVQAEGHYVPGVEGILIHIFEPTRCRGISYAVSCLKNKFLPVL